MKDPFDILGISADADPETIEDAYRRLAQIYHPDRFGPSSSTGVREEAERRMKAVNEARDEIRRRQARRAAAAPQVTLECSRCAHREEVPVSRARSARCSTCGTPFSTPRPSAGSSASSAAGASTTSTSGPRSSTPSAEASRPSTPIQSPAAATGSNSARAWVFWVVIIGAAFFVAQLERSPTPLREDDVRQTAANLAFAQREYKSNQGAYTSDVRTLDVEIADERIEVATFASDTEFCVQAQGGGTTFATWDTQFEGDEVQLWQRSCGGSSTPPEFAEPGFEERQREQADLWDSLLYTWDEFDIERDYAFGRGLAIDKACWDRFEMRKQPIESEFDAITEKETLTSYDVTRADELFKEYKKLVNRQGLC